MAKSTGYIVRESFLIVFSILLALGVNEWRSRAADARALKQAVRDVRAEIGRNLDALEGLPDYQRGVAAALQDLAVRIGAEEGDNARPAILWLDAIEKKRATAIGLDRPLLSVSWTTFKSRPAFGNLDYDTARALSAAYDLQLASLTAALDDIVEMLVAPDMFDVDAAPAVLGALSMRFAEAGGRADLMIRVLTEAQAAIDRAYPEAAD